MKRSVGRLVSNTSCVLSFCGVLLAVCDCAWAQGAKGKDDSDAFVRPDGRLIEKLIVVHSGADFKPHPNSKLKEGVEPPKPYSIFWHLKARTEDEKKRDGEGYDVAGNIEGEPVCYIKKDDVRPWKTRFALDPKLPGADTGFKVFTDVETKNPKIEFVGDAGKVPEGYRRFAMITEPSKDDDKDEDSAAFPVIAFTGALQAGGGGPGVKKEELQKVDIKELQLEVVFCIDTTGSMQPTVDTVKEVIQRVAADLSGGGSAQNVKGAVKFGLVEYRDTPDQANTAFITKVTLPLNSDPNMLYAALKKVTCEGGGDYPEAVTMGMLTAIEDKSIGWGETSAKHVILIGDAPNKDIPTYPKLKPPTISDIIKMANKPGGSDQQRALGAVMIHSVAAYGFNPDPSNPNGEGLDPKLKEDFMKMTQGDKQGYAGTMNVKDSASKESVIKDLTAFLREGMKMLGGIRETGKISEKEAPTTEIGKVAAASFYRILDTSGPVGDAKSQTLDGFARGVDDKGNRVATKKILVMRGELLRLWSGLDNLIVQFKRLKQGRGDIGEIIKKLHESLAGTAAGEVIITDTTTLEEIIGKDLPMKTPALRLTIGQVATMESKDFDNVLDTLSKARETAQKLNDNPKQWSEVNDFMGDSSKAAFLEQSDLP